MELELAIKEARELSLGNELEQIFSKVQVMDKTYVKSYLSYIMSLSKIYNSYCLILQTQTIKEDFTTKKIREHVLNLNYQTAESLHYLIQITKLANIDTDDINNYYETLLSELNLKDSYYRKENVLNTCMEYGRYCNIKDNIYNNPEINLRPVILMKDVVDDNFTYAGRIIDITFGRIMGYFSWDVTHTMTTAHISYPVDPKPGDWQLYHKNLMVAWLYFFKYLDLLGHNWDSVGRIYSVYNHIKTKQHA